MADDSAAQPSQAPCTLYQWPEAWGLPSISPACIQAQAYLRFTGTELFIESCSSSSKSPTGQLPALERDPDITTAEGDEYSAALACIRFAQKNVKDLDAHLAGPQKAQLLAFTTAVNAKLNPATALSAWSEGQGFVELKKAAFSKLPFPLNYVIPWSMQREVRRQYGKLNPEQVFDEAAELLSALADHFRATDRKFFFGSTPSSLDALLYGHLTFYKNSLAAAPLLKSKVATDRALCDFVSRVTSQYFSDMLLDAANGQQQAGDGTSGPRASSSGGAGAANGQPSSSSWSSWSDAAKGRKQQQRKVAPSEAERQFKRYSQYWLLGAGAAIAAYVLLSGNYVQFVQMAQDALTDSDDVEDDDGGDDE